MSILFIGSDPDGTGGIQRYNSSLLAALKGQGQEVFVLARERQSAIKFSISAVRQILKKRPALIWCGHLNFAPLGYFFSIFGIPYVVATYGIEVWDMKDKEKKWLRRARRVCFISNYSKKKILAQCPSLDSKLFFLPPAFDDAFFTPADPGEIKSQKKVILTVTRLDAREQYKGYDRVLRALPVVLKEIPQAEYIIAGGDGGDVGRVKGIISSLHLEAKVSISTNVSKELLRDLYREAAVFIMPSTGEGFGIVYLEAIACGTLAIGGNKDGSTEPLQNGRLGILVDPENEEEITQVLIKALRGDIPAEYSSSDKLREEAVRLFGVSAFNVRVAALTQELFHV